MLIHVLPCFHQCTCKWCVQLHDHLLQTLHARLGSLHHRLTVKLLSWARLGTLWCTSLCSGLTCAILEQHAATYPSSVIFADYYLPGLQCSVMYPLHRKCCSLPVPSFLLPGLSTPTVMFHNCLNGSHWIILGIWYLLMFFPSANLECSGMIGYDMEI